MGKRVNEHGTLSRILKKHLIRKDNDILIIIKYTEDRITKCIIEKIDCDYSELVNAINKIFDEDEYNGKRKGK